METRNSVCVSHVGGRDASIWGIFSCLPRVYVSRMLDLNWSQNTPSTLIWIHSVVTAAANPPLPAPSYFDFIFLFFLVLHLLPLFMLSSSWFLSFYFAIAVTSAICFIALMVLFVLFPVFGGQVGRFFPSFCLPFLLKTRFAWLMRLVYWLFCLHQTLWVVVGSVFCVP